MPNNVQDADLVDIRDIAVNKNLPQTARIAEYARQIKNPRHYKYKNFSVTAIYADNGVTIEDCLRALMT